MGLLRALLGVSTGGIVGFRSKDARAARYARQTRNAARALVAQNAAQLELQREQLAAANHANIREEVRAYQAERAQSQAYGQPQLAQPSVASIETPPPGWYVDARNPSIERWFDGARWAATTRVRHQ